MENNVKKTILETLQVKGKISSNQLRKIVIDETGVANSTYNYNLKQLYLKDKEIKREPSQWDFKKNVYYYLNEKEQKQFIKPKLIDVTQVDKAISKLIYELNRIPTMEQIKVELEIDPEKHEMLYNLIFERLALFQKQQNVLNKEIMNIFYKKVKTFGKTKKYEENKCIPTDEEIMNKLDWTESERSNPSLIALVWLCKKRFLDKQNFLA